MSAGKDARHFDGAAYWNERYIKGGNSGEGSYGRLADFKAEVVNSYIAEKGIVSVIELGSGDGNQFELLRVPSYVGLDVSPEAVQRCRKRFAGRQGCSFHLPDEVAEGTAFHMAMSLDVIFHLIDDDVYERYMRRLFDHARRSVIVYSSNRADNGRQASHVRHRKFTNWIEANQPDWRLARYIPNRYPLTLLRRKNRSFANFFIFEPAVERAIHRS